MTEGRRFLSTTSDPSFMAFLMLYPNLSRVIRYKAHHCNDLLQFPIPGDYSRVHVHVDTASNGPDMPGSAPNAFYRVLGTDGELVVSHSLTIIPTMPSRVGETRQESCRDRKKAGAKWAAG
jgi:hypothetical protein